MSKYLDKLNQIEKQLKEEVNANAEGQFDSQSSRNSSRSSNDVRFSKESSDNGSTHGNWRSSVGRGRISSQTRKITKVERSKSVMIPAKSVWSDFEAIEKENIDDAAKCKKMLYKVVKLILNTRSNEVKIMDKLGIPRETGEVKEDKPAK